MVLSQYLALLRGINVGGSNIIRMADLKTSFEELGFADVLTYIQSGNVLFKSEVKNSAALAEQIEQHLSERFRQTSRVVLVQHKKLKTVVEDAPAGFGADAANYRYDVIFLKEPLSAKEAMKSVPLKQGVDQAYEGKGVLYFSRLIARASQSHLSRIVSLSVYKNMTIRNWNTTTKLLSLMDRRKGSKIGPKDQDKD